MSISHDQLVRFMLSPSFYPHDPPSVDLVQTHISSVFIAGDKVYKIKKPVDFGFLDFTTLEKRKFFCDEEIRLNSRLAPSVYKSVATVTDDGAGNPVLNGDGPVIEYAVVMRRLPEERMLYRLLQEGHVDDTVMDAIARLLHEFHRKADTGGEIDQLGSLDTIMMNHDENFDQTEPFIDRTISAPAHAFMKACAHKFMKDNEELFQRRVSEHRIRDCHGDLHLQHICLDGDEIVIFDCIEFNRRFRSLDVAAEIAFLSMDLEGNGYTGLARTFINAYIRYSGDAGAEKLLNFYRAYFAFVRGKVTGFRLDDPSMEEADRTAVIDEATRYFDRSARYAARTEHPVLVITAGLMGTGKSFLADRLARYLDARIIQTDVLRKEMLGIDSSERHYENFEEGIYSAETTRKTYEAALERAEAFIAAGESVILDASFRSRRDRGRARESARRAGAGFFIVECLCPESTVRERLEKRTTQSGQASDGRWELYETQKKSFEAVEEIESGEHVRADTSLHPDACLFNVLEKIKGIDRTEH